MLTLLTSPQMLLALTPLASGLVAAKCKKLQKMQKYYKGETHPFHSIRSLSVCITLAYFYNHGMS